MIQLTNSCLIKEYWRTNQLINEQTCKTFLKMVYYEWLTHWLWISTFFYFYFVGCEDIKWPTNLYNIYEKKVIYNWLTEYISDWLIDSLFLGCALALKINISVLCPTEYYFLSLCPLHLSVIHTTHCVCSSSLLRNNILFLFDPNYSVPSPPTRTDLSPPSKIPSAPSKACPDFRLSALFFGKCKSSSVH